MFNKSFNYKLSQDILYRSLILAPNNELIYEDYTYEENEYTAFTDSLEFVSEDFMNHFMLAKVEAFLTYKKDFSDIYDDASMFLKSQGYLFLKNTETELNFRVEKMSDKKFLPALKSIVIENNIQEIIIAYKSIYRKMYDDEFVKLKSFNFLMSEL